MPPETAQALLAAAVARLRAAGCDTPELDARLLFQAATGLSREDLILASDHVIAAEHQARFEGFLQRREEREPVSRILGEREFYGRPFRVTPDVLDPRPDTETLIDAALRLMPGAARILDLGTGSGAIAVTLLAERADAFGLAVDVSEAALAVARENAARLGVTDRLTLAQGSWFSSVSGRFDIIASNPPYIPAAEIAGLSPDVRNFEPVLALLGGEDGLDPYRIIAATAGVHLNPAGHVLVEIGAGQGPAIEAIFAGHGFRLRAAHADLGGHFRCLDFAV